MDTIKAFSKALLLCGCVITAPGALHAETISQDAGVTIVRGADDAATAAQRNISRGRSGVTIFRGQSASAPSDQEPAIMAGPAPTLLIGGQNLWIYEAGADAPIACSLRYDVYGNEKVVCAGY